MLLKKVCPSLSCNQGLALSEDSAVACRGLFLADNHITQVPDLALMPYLHTLELARNHLTSLGSAPLSSATLCCLDLSHNRLTTLSQLQHLPKLRELTVSDNQLTNLEGLQVRSCTAHAPVYHSLFLSCLHAPNHVVRRQADKIKL